LSWRRNKVLVISTAEQEDYKSINERKFKEQMGKFYFHFTVVNVNAVVEVQ